MKKYIIVVVVLFSSFSVFAQLEAKVKYENKGDVVLATYFYEDGTIQQEGTFNKDGQLHGTWTSYDVNGAKLAVGHYMNGIKTGKWLFWGDKVLKEVDFVDSQIASVDEWKHKAKIALKDK
ncbi:MAG: hypothetical protein HRT67_02205 [Flavobacteriaceae bacterium]|nr:hypothetical protein [Flavobacteriaceae bacterium]